MTTYKTGIFGYPMNHTKASRLYQHWIARYEIDGSYEAVRVKPEQLESTLRGHVAEGWRGGSVTMPHKEAAHAIADEVTERAAAIGSSNTLIFKDGKIIADNADGLGFMENLRATAGDRFQSSKPALVLGAGGASRAIIHGLLEAGVPEVRLANRTRERAEVLREQFGQRVSVIDWRSAESCLPGAATIVNTTSMGMTDLPALSFSLDQADNDAVVADIVVQTKLTAFLKDAQARNLAVVEGLGMLLHQAPPGFEAWFGVKPQVDEQVKQVMLAP